MDLFVEKEFLEEFELDYDCSAYKSDAQKIVFSILTEYTKVRLFINAPLSFVQESRLLSLFTDINLNIQFDIDFDSWFKNQFHLSNQSVIFFKNIDAWISAARKKGALCFSYSDYETEIQRFINDTHFKIDLSDKDNLPIKWNIFKFLDRETNFIVISDPYILCDSTGQEIRKNLIPLLTENINKDHHYSLFIITEVYKEFEKEIDNKIRLINSALANYNINVYLFNRIKGNIEKFILHDRLLYSNYTITDSGIGFNLTGNKPRNSQIISASFFEKHTYNRLKNHFKELGEYVNQLEKYIHSENPYKTNTIKAFDAFRKITENI